MKRSALITGGQGRLAQAMQMALVQAGYTVHAPGRRDLDAESTESIQRWKEKHGVPDYLILNAGGSLDQVVARLSVEAWDQVVSTNLHSAVRTTRVFLPAMTAGSHVLAISSHSALLGHVGQAHYAAAKAALLAWMQSLAREVGPDGIRVNAVLPGILPTPMVERLSPEQQEQLRRQETLGCFNDLESVARFVVFLDGMPNTSGQLFQLDSRITPWT